MMLLGGAICTAQGAPGISLRSPEGTMGVEMDYRADSDSTGSLHWSVTFKGQPIVTDSRAGLDLDNRHWEMAIALGKYTSSGMLDG